MTEREKKALADAFGFEEPDRKEEFTEIFRKKEFFQYKRQIFPTAVKFTATAAIIAAIVSTALIMPQNRHSFITNDNEISVTGTATTAVPATTTAFAVSAGAEVTTVKNTAAKAANTTVTTQTVTNALKGVGTTQKTSEEPTSKPELTKAIKEQEASSAVVTTEAEDTALETSAVRDMTVSPENVIALRERLISEEELSEPLSDYAGSPDVGRKDEVVPNHSKSSQSMSLSMMYKNSCAVVLANLDEIVYTSIGGYAYTAENLTVERVYKGSLGEKDRITVFFSGGYLPAEDYISLYCKEYLQDAGEYSVRISGDCRGEQLKGRKYVFFLTDGSYPLPVGGFAPVFLGDSSVFEDIDGIYTAVGDTELTFTPQQAVDGF